MAPFSTNPKYSEAGVTDPSVQVLIATECGGDGANEGVCCHAEPDFNFSLTKNF